MTKAAMEFGEELQRSATLAHRVESGWWRDMGQERLELWWQLKHSMKIQGKVRERTSQDGISLVFRGRDVDGFDEDVHRNK